MRKFLWCLLSFALLMIIVPTPVFADGAISVPQSGENDNIQYSRVSNGFIVNGRDGSTYIKTTSGETGYTTVMQVGSSNTVTFSDFEYGKPYTLDGVNGSVTASLNSKAVKFTYELENTTDTLKSVKIGSYADVQIYEDDKAPIKFEKGGITMSYNNDSTNTHYDFKIIPGGVDFST